MKSTTKDVWLDVEDVVLAKEIAKGSHGTVHQGTFAGLEVAIKEIPISNSNTRIVSNFNNFLSSEL